MMTTAEPASPPLPATLSPSKLSTFTTCGLQFRFSAIDRLPEPPTRAAVRGTAAHLVLQRLFRRPSAERTLAAALDELEPSRRELADDDEMVGLQLDEQEEALFWDEVSRLVSAYFTLEDPQSVHAVGLEVMLSAPLPDSDVVLRGIIDRLDWIGPGEFEVVDYKSGKAPPRQFERSRLDGVKFYALLVEQVLGVAPTRVRLIYLGGDEPEQVVLPVRQGRTAATARRASAAWSAIARAHASDGFRPNPSRLCDWCSFQEFCPSFGGDPGEARRQAVTLRQ